MSRRPIRIAVIAGIIAVIAALIWWNTRPEPITVRAVTAERGTVERTVANTRAGTVEACRRAQLTPSIGGQVAALPVQEGDFVEAGQLLLELWNNDLKAQVELAAAESQAAQATTRSSCAQADAADREAARIARLRRDGLASEEQADRADTNARALRAQCQAAVARANVSIASMKVAAANLERTRLIAPFEGVVAEITAELNEFVTPSPVGVAIPPAIDLIDNTCFYVTAPIDEVDAPGIAVDMPARITLDAFKNRAFEGRVRRIGSYVVDYEKQARTVDIEAEFVVAEDILDLLAGYSADVEVLLDRREDALRVPTEAVIDGERLYVVTPRGTAERRSIQTGLSNWSYTEVLDGLTAGEQVITSIDRAGLADGVPVRVGDERP